MSLWGNSWLSLKGSGDLGRFPRTGREQMSGEGGGGGKNYRKVNLSSIGRWWSNQSWKLFPNTRRLRESGLISLEKRKFRGILSMYVIPDGRKWIRRSWTLFSGAQSKDNWQWAQIEIQKNSLKHKKQLFHDGSGQPLEHVATRGRGVSIHEDIKNSTGCSPELSALADSAWAGPSD